MLGPRPSRRGSMPAWRRPLPRPASAARHGLFRGVGLTADCGIRWVGEVIEWRWHNCFETSRDAARPRPIIADRVKCAARGTYFGSCSAKIPSGQAASAAGLLVHRGAAMANCTSKSPIILQGAGRVTTGCRIHAQHVRRIIVRRHYASRYSPPFREDSGNRAWLRACSSRGRVVADSACRRLGLVPSR